jgi:signal transduction histidine kinase/CheY-like chemotaxis protein
MTLAAAIALMSTGIACYVAVLSRQFSRAPGWQDQRYFSLVALAVAGYAALNVTATWPLFSDRVVLAASRVQFLLAALHSAAWLRYSSVLVGQARSRIDRILAPALAAVGALGALAPGFFGAGVRTHAFEPLGIVYRSPVMSPIADGAYAGVLLVLLVPIVRFGRSWRRGVPNTGVQFVALVGLLVLAVNDLLVTSGAYSAPFLVDIAFLLPIAAVGYMLTARFVEDARAHQALRSGLEQQVAERTAELGRAQGALHRAEKLAALGQFAAGVAHEVNNPASVVSANLAYLDQAESDVLTDDGREAVKESIRSVQRIAAIVRQLLDAGRLAAAPEARKNVPLQPLGDGAMSVARARFGKRVRVTNLVPDDLHAAGHEGVLAQVLANLVANAVQSIADHRSDGHVVIRAAEDRGTERVRVTVEDNGSGMEPEILRRAFEPFFTTKPFGSGTGLGLAVSRGLIMSLGGDLRLESTPGKGTRATIELTSAAPASPPPAHGRLAARNEPRRRLLIVDDESAVRSSLRRLLEPAYGVELASGVDEALDRLHVEPFDLVLCDVMMPAGGGERLYRTLLGRTPSIARRIVFFTGGAVTDAARQFIHSQPQPVLSKPLDVEDLSRVAQAMCGRPVDGYPPTP